MKTRVLNCAKVTRADGKFREDVPDPKLLDKFKKLIKKFAPAKATQHELTSAKDSHSGFEGKQKPSSLDRELTKLRKKGRKVLDFWRDNGRWQIKVMAR